MLGLGGTPHQLEETMHPRTGKMWAPQLVHKIIGTAEQRAEALRA